MKLIRYEDSNSNARFIADLVSKTKYYKNNNYYWVLSDVELIPLFHSDYFGSGGASAEEIAYRFLIKHENEKISVMCWDELSNLLEDTQTIRYGVLACFENTISVNKETFRPKVETIDPQKICHEDAELEIRILDGDLFYLFGNY